MRRLILLFSIALLLTSPAQAYGKNPRRVSSGELARSVWMRIQQTWSRDHFYDHEARRLELVLALHHERARGRGDGEGARFLADRLDQVEREHCDARDMQDRARRVRLDAARARELRALLVRHRAAASRLRSLERLASRRPAPPPEKSWLKDEDQALEAPPPPPPPSALEKAREAFEDLPRLEPFMPVPICRYR